MGKYLDLSKNNGAKRTLALIFGPATVVSVAYMDPGNFGSNISAGTEFGLALLWVVWVSGFIAMLFQYLSGKLGLASRKSILDLVLEYIGKGGIRSVARTAYFVPIIIMILATDMAEFLGIALGLYLLFGIPLDLAVLIALLDIFVLFIAVDRAKMFETLIGLLVGVIGISFIYELYIVNIDFLEVAKWSVTVSLENERQILLSTAIIGATVMPHAVLLHAYLARDKWPKGSREQMISNLKRHMKETIVYLSIASLVNASIQIMGYYAFNRNGITEAIDMDKAYYILQPLYGETASIVFGIAMLASGISSSMVSVQSGVYSVESFFGVKLKRWMLRAIVRFINMVPLLIAIKIGMRSVDILIYSQVVLSLTLPAVIIPLTIFTARKKIMGEYRNILVTNILAVISAVFILGINLFLVFSGKWELLE